MTTLEERLLAHRENLDTIVQAKLTPSDDQRLADLVTYLRSRDINANRSSVVREFILAGLEQAEADQRAAAR